MKTLRSILGLSLLLVFFLTFGEVHGQKRSNKIGVKTERKMGGNSVGKAYRADDRFRTQPIRRNPNYRYPHHRRVVRTLPRYHVRLVHRGLPYFYYSGIYYTLYGDEYMVVMPPRGFRISVLPVGHVRIVVGHSVFYYHSGVYYSETVSTSSDNNEKYEVTQPPVGVILCEIHKDSEEIIIDGKVLFEYNDVFYKKNSTYDGKTTYEVVYSKPQNDI
ncbi:DUF6515 family protein [Seonamhaeicola maritimus]|uniref:Uncharacterized protein n=1 Tax=Seonamhaeicola maritimus TaxID=2591822 RepID=A0A5C7GLS3_9FLAO|nr:DUF6515 family protein [Seonamhaeicola maritimus]TXG39234.1 hypothetical protein FUA22_04985 [Seonamhaeicola maritimus]